MEMFRSPEIRWIFAAQVVFAAVVTVLAGLFCGLYGATSAALGGIIGVVANFGSALRALRIGGKTTPMHLFRALVAGEVLKFALVVLLFCLVFAAYRDVAVPPLFAGFISTLVVYWVALLKQS